MHAVITEVLDNWCHSKGTLWGTRLLSLMACGKLTADPFEGVDKILAQKLTQFLQEHGSYEVLPPGHAAHVINLPLLRALARLLDDPDAEITALLHSCVPVGWHQRLPRTPAVFDRKTHWSSHVGKTSRPKNGTRTTPRRTPLWMPFAPRSRSSAWLG